MDHPEHLLDARATRALTRAEQAELDLHLAGCAVCRLELRWRQDQAVRQPLAGDDALLERAVEAALRRTPELARPPLALPLRRRWWLLAAAILVVATAAGAGSVAYRTRLKDAPSPPPESSVSRPAEPPPLERSLTRRAAEAPSPPSSAGVPAAPPAASAVAAAPEGAPGLFARANAARHGGASAEAASLYRELMRKHPASREASNARIVLAQLLLDRLGDAPGALELFDTYLGSTPGPLAEEARVGRARCLGRLGRSAEERAAWEDLLRLHPGSAHSERARRRIEELSGTVQSP